MNKELFKKRKVKGLDIPEAGPYDLTNDDDLKSCGLDRESFLARNEGLFDDFDIGKDQNIVACLAQRLESRFSKREIAYLMAKTSAKMLMQEAVNIVREKKK